MSTPNTHFGAQTIARLLQGVRSIYFIGIGGVSMSALARLTKQKGYAVGGYDRTASAVTRQLAEQGIAVDHVAKDANLDGYGAVVYTVAISAEQPEYRAARERGLPLISRSDYMGYLMMDYTVRIGFAGSHGKSTATCMCAQLFMSADADPTVLAGAVMPSIGGVFRNGSQQTMVFEACEYMDSFLDFNPTVAVVLNAELDHVDYFHSQEQLCTSYARFASRVGEAGTVIYNRDDEQTVAAMRHAGGRHVTFGLCGEADYTAREVRVLEGCAHFELWHRGECLTTIRLRVLGKHNVYNALAACAAAHECGLSAAQLTAGLADFKGVSRRMEYKGRVNGAVLYDDYAHHSTEVDTVVREARLLCEGRLICVFQPHTYSRTAALFDAYVTALSQADEVLLAPIYAARETDTCGISTQALAAAIGPQARAFDDLGTLSHALCESAKKGDTVLVMGAGNIDAIYDMLPLRTDE